jgi:hypothetical protein
MTQNSNANPAIKMTSSDLKSPEAKHPAINTEAVSDMKKATSMAQVDQIMSTAFKQMEQKYGRPMTYAEMRAEFG